MDHNEFINLLNQLLHEKSETEWLEFKKNNIDADMIGEYLSALANAASLHDKPHGYLVFGIEDKTHLVKGTDFHPKQTKIGNEELENWLARLLSPRIDFRIHETEYNNCKVVIFIVDPAISQPVSFKGTPYIRIGSYKKKTF